MGDFKRRKPGSDKRSGGPRQFSRGGFRGRDSSRSRFERVGSSDRESFEATCDKCGKECTLPFKPTSGKPVFCRECFRKNDGSETRSSSNNSGELRHINEKLDKIMRALKIE